MDNKLLHFWVSKLCNVLYGEIKFEKSLTKMDTADMDITVIDQSKDFELYENIRLPAPKPATTSSAQKYEEDHYETLQYEGAKKPNVEADTKETTMKGQKLNIVIYIILVLISVLYVAFIVLVIFLFTPKDAVVSQWAEWSSWTSCDVTCRNGTILRTRTCTNPVPMDKGTDCVGDSLQRSLCFNNNCPVDGLWAEWSSWTSCDVTCGNGTILRTRACTNPIPMDKGADCVGDSLQSSLCFNNNCPVDGQWAEWSSWTSCDVTCGNGKILRTRTCTNPVPMDKGADCVGDSLQRSLCLNNNCPVDGQWTYWSSWTSCDVTCGKGSHLRTRRCSNPFPANNGKDCIGESLQNRACSKEKCPAFMSAFSVQKPHFYGVINGRSKMNFTNTIYQYGSDFNISSGTYTCTIPGVYHFSATLVKKRSSPRVDLVSCHMYKNSRNLIKIIVDPTDDDTDIGSAAVSQSIVIDLEKGDTVYLSNCNSQPDKNMESWSSFTGFLLYHND